MCNSMFKALVLKKAEKAQNTLSIEDLSIDDLPKEEVLIKVEYSTLNYKDSLAVTNKLPIVKNYPMVPGIDLAGIVKKSSNKNFFIGDKVLFNGNGLGEITWGGMSQMACVNGDYLIKIPSTFSTKQAMTIGTAGYTAMLAVLALEKNKITPDKGEILVTGATGGVGSVSLMILNRLGYNVCAATGKTENVEYLKSLGAKRVIDRNVLSKECKPLEKEIWSGVIDTVGSKILANACASVKYGGTLVLCGLAQGFDFSTTVMPFILRGINLCGIDSVYCPLKLRQQAWERLGENIDLEKLGSISSLITLNEVLDFAKKMLAGSTKGRIVIDVNKKF